VQITSSTNEMATTGSSSNTAPPVPTDGLLHLTPSSLSSSLSDLVDYVLGLVVYTQNVKTVSPLIYSIRS
jgi:hypothetical protein